MGFVVGECWTRKSKFGKGVTAFKTLCHVYGVIAASRGFSGVCVLGCNGAAEVRHRRYALRSSGARNTICPLNACQRRVVFCLNARVPLCYEADATGSWLDVDSSCQIQPQRS